MSGPLVIWALDCPHTSRAEKLVLVTLCSRADHETKRCFPSVADICRRTGYSKRAVQSHLSNLEAKGLIARDTRYRDDGSQTSTLYTVRGDVIYEYGDVSKSAPGGAADCTGGVQPGAPLEISDEISNKASLSLELENPNIKIAFDAYNAIAEQNGLPTARKLTAGRSRAINARIKDEDGLQGFRAVLDQLNHSSYLKDKNWFDLDWLLKPECWEKVRRGKYADEPEPKEWWEA